MSESTLITREKSDRILASLVAGRNEIVDRLAARLHELVPQILSSRDEEAVRTLIKRETDRAGEELKALAATLRDQLDAIEH